MMEKVKNGEIWVEKRGRKRVWLDTNERMVSCVESGSFYFLQSEGVSSDLPALNPND